MEKPNATGGGAIALGILAGFLLNFAGFMLIVALDPKDGTYAGLWYLVYFGALQLIWMVPISIGCFLAKQASFAKGLLIIAGITLLLWVSCWSIMGLGSVFSK